MKVTEKIALSAAAAVLGMSGIFAEDMKISFENELSSDIVSIEKKDDETKTKATGIVEKAKFELESEKIEAAIEVEFTVDQDDDDKGRVYWSDIDYGFVFHPVEMIALGWHAGLETEGCVLPIYDDNLESGKFGSDGFTLQVTPVDGLRLAVSVPFGEGGENCNWTNNKDVSDFNICFGAEYTLADKFVLGAALRNAVDEDKRSVGAFISTTPIENLKVNVGFTKAEAGDGFDDLSISENFGVEGKKLVNGYVEYSIDKIALAAEVLCSLDDEDGDYDLYAALSAKYGINENIAASLEGKFLFDNTSDGLKPVTGGKISAEYSVNENNVISAGVKFEACDGNTYTAFPVVWTYSF